MPRTKVVNSKRNRNAGKEDKIKDFEMQLENNLMVFEMKARQENESISTLIENMINELPIDILKMKLTDLIALVSLFGIL